MLQCCGGQSILKGEALQHLATLCGLPAASLASTACTKARHLSLSSWQLLWLWCAAVLLQKLQQLLHCVLGGQGSPKEIACGCIFNFSLLIPEACCRHKSSRHCQNITLLTLHSCQVRIRKAL